MKYYTKRLNSIETICVDRISKGIKSIKKGTRCGDSIGKDLEFFFNQLEKSNKELYNDLYMKYSLARLEFEKKLEDIHS